SVEVAPVLDLRGRPWHAQVVREEEASGKPSPIVFEGNVETDGNLVVASQSPGRYRIGILDSLGNRLAASEVTLDGPGVPPQRIVVRLVTLEGTLRLGQEPLAASLWFGGRSGAIRVRLESDEEGRFHGILPREGDWSLDVESSQPRLRTRARIDVLANRAGKATADIVLPDTRVFGTVVDTKGKPVPRADVLVMTERLEFLDTADALG